MDTDRQGFAQRGALARQPVRHLEQEALGEQHPLRVTTDVSVGVAHTFDAPIHDSARYRSHARTRLEAAFGAGSVLDHFRAEFVPENDILRQIHPLAPRHMGEGLVHEIRVAARVQVGATDAASERLHEYLAGARLRVR